MFQSTSSFTIGIFIDLRKAFDKVDHGVLVKQNIYGLLRGVHKNNWYSELNRDSCRYFHHLLD